VIIEQEKTSESGQNHLGYAQILVVLGQSHTILPKGVSYE